MKSGQINLRSAVHWHKTFTIRPAVTQGSANPAGIPKGDAYPPRGAITAEKKKELLSFSNRQLNPTRKKRCPRQGTHTPARKGRTARFHQLSHPRCRRLERSLSRRTAFPLSPTARTCSADDESGGGKRRTLAGSVIKGINKSIPSIVPGIRHGLVMPRHLTTHVG